FEELVRAVNTTLDPPRVAEIIVEHASQWLPVSAWAVVSGQLQVLADKNLTTPMRHAVDAAAAWVVQSGEEFATASFALDNRIHASHGGAGLAFPLSCRGRHVGALVAIHDAPSTRQPKLATPLAAAVRRLLEPAAVALDNALLLKRAEALSVTDEL